MNMNVTIPRGLPAAADPWGEDIEQSGARLRMIDRIDMGHGVVPVLEEGSVLLQMGEVAVYREEQISELTPGLYCLEIQHLAGSSHRDSPRRIDRKVVYARPSSHGTSEGNWEYVTLRSKIINGVRRYARPEGPIYAWALGDLLLGPIVGIYAPSAFSKEC